jgi:hypothetical protein
MRCIVASVVFPLSALACGGTTPPPKADDQAKAPPASSITASEAGAPVPTTAAIEPPPAPSVAEPPDSGPAEEDPWLAFRHMPGGDVLKTMRPAQAKVQACIHAGLKRDPTASGEIKIRFVVTQDGKVLDWKDEASSMSDEEITKCIGDIIRTLTFPKQKMPGNSLGFYTIQLSN